MQQRTFYLLIALIAFVALAVRVPLLDRPLDRDEGLYAYMAQRMARGDVPYRDVFSDKPPVGFVLYRLFFLLFGESVRAAHLGGAIWCAASTILLALCVRRFSDELTGVVAALLYATACAEPGVQGSSINLEILLTPFVLLASWFVRERVTATGLLLVGVLLALAGLTKQQAIGHAIFVVAGVAAVELRSGWIRLVRAFLLIGVGGALVIAVVVAGFWLAGGLGHFLDGVWFYNVSAYVRREPLVRAFSNALRTSQDLLLAHPLLYVSVVAGFLGALDRERRGAVYWFSIWWLLNLLAAAIGFRFYRHYFLLTRPAACALGAVGITWAVAAMRRGPAAMGALVLASVVAISPLALNFRYFFTATDEEFVEMLYGPEIFAWSDELAAEMAARSKPEEPVYISGSEPQIYFLARRRCVGRYAFIHPLTTAAPDVRQRVNEAIDALLNQPPPVILVVAVPMSTMLDPRIPPYYEEAFTRIVRVLYRSELALLRGPRGRYFLRAQPGAELRLTPEQARACDALLMVRR